MNPAKALSYLPLLEPVARFILSAVAHRHTDAMTPQEADRRAAEALKEYRAVLDGRGK